MTQIATTSAPAPVRAEAEVVQNLHEGGANYRLTLRVTGWPGFEPGQFVMLSAGPQASVPRTDPLLPRPMAVYRTRQHAQGTLVDVLYKRVGRGTALLAQALPGQKVGLVGPLGRGFELPGAAERALLVAGGTGIASVYELAARLVPRVDVRVLLGAATEQDLMGVDDFAALGVELEIATEDGSRGFQGRVTRLLEDALAGRKPGTTRIYSCGPTGMMRRCAEIASRAGVPCIVSLENQMACGFGVCLGCAAPLSNGSYALVCRDGPSFDASTIAWQGLP